jgi:hypothetical protein
MRFFPTWILVLVLAMVFIGLVSCRKFEEYPPQPYIEFRDFALMMNQQTGITDKGVLRIFYRDGDGDLGLEQGDTLPPFERSGDYHYNLIINYYEIQNGQRTLVPLVTWNNTTQQYDTLTLNARMPLLLPRNQRKSIQGIIDYELFVYNPLSNYDTIQLTVQVIDRTLHLSNEVITPPIVLIKP